MNYQLAEVLGRSLWLMDKAALLRLWQAANEATPEAVNAAMLAARDRQPAMPRMMGSVAVIDVSGPITYRESFFSAFFDSPTIERMREQFRVALADPEAKAIVFRMDSPGGTVDGLQDFAAEVFAARGQKPIVAVSDTLMASAAYWLGAQADTVVVERSSRTGSIGVWTAHEDISGMLEQMGINVTLIFAGEHKMDGHPFGPLSDEVRADLQKEVNEVHAEFIADVARGRGVTAAEVRKSYGQGKLYPAREAVKFGVADKSSSFETTLARLMGRRASGNGTVRGLVRAADMNAAAADALVDLTPTWDGTGLRDSLPLFTGALDTIGSITCRKDKADSILLVGDWPARAAFSAELLNKATNDLRIVGQDIQITLANGAATYRAIGRTLRDEIVADRMAWATTEAKKHTDTMPPDEDGNCPEDYEMGDDGMCHMMSDEAKRAQQQAKVDNDALAVAIALGE